MTKGRMRGVPWSLLCRQTSLETLNPDTPKPRMYRKARTVRQGEIGEGGEDARHVVVVQLPPDQLRHALLQLLRVNCVPLPPMPVLLARPRRQGLHPDALLSRFL